MASLTSSILLQEARLAVDPIRAREVHLARRPGASLQTEDFALREKVLPPLAEGQFLIRNRYLSIDPVRRVFFSNGTAPLNAGLHSFALGEVVASRHPLHAVGDTVSHYGGLRDFAVSDGSEVRRIPLNGEPFHWHADALGIGGFFAYTGLLEVARARPGETVFVSSAAGSVGSLATQLARLIGCRVIASAGSDAKRDWLAEVAGAHVAINYRAENLSDALACAAPEGIDVYFDNVGGDHLDAALEHINSHGRVAICGMVSAYDSATQFGERAGAWTWKMMTGQVEIRSYQARDYMRLWPAFQRSIGTWLREGAIRSETRLLPGLESVPQAFVDLLAGNAMGKTLVEIPA
ncbi:MAG TPA: NADP-dependent oxidoreductase [Sphingobium sp.]|uniref:NADP-dependent oxidoreductase n=1 Tax=Sphingobium sp. TaxID=1912891 RepID=UPI002ED6502F